MQSVDPGADTRSAVFYTSDEQRVIAEDTIADVDAADLWPGSVATEVTLAADFGEAEPEHQDYFARHPSGSACRSLRSTLRLPRRAGAKAT